MDLLLARRKDGYRSDGIFSDLVENNGTVASIAVTVEHAYVRVDPAVQNAAASYPGLEFIPKLPPGAYRCVRGMHRLDGMTEDFETFEITGVEGHTGLVFHWGNFNRSSKGCVCTGLKEVVGPEDYDQRDGPDHMVTNSRATFEHFMDLQQGTDAFILTVTA